MMQEERDKENSLQAAQRETQAKARGAALQARRSKEDADCLLAISSFKAAMKQQQLLQAPDSFLLASAPVSHATAESRRQALIRDVTQPEPSSVAAAYKATGLIGSAAVPGRHRRSASWVQRRASSVDDVSAAALAEALLAGPRVAHQKSSSHESGLAGKLPGLGKQRSRLSSATAHSVADGGQAQA